jgi:hypothetical protein
VLQNGILREAKFISKQEVQTGSENTLGKRLDEQFLCLSPRL